MGAGPPPRLDRSLVCEFLGAGARTESERATCEYGHGNHDDNATYMRGGLAPPMYHVALAVLAMPRETMVAKGLDVVGARIGVHAAHDMRLLLVGR